MDNRMVNNISTIIISSSSITGGIERDGIERDGRRRAGRVEQRRMGEVELDDFQSNDETIFHSPSFVNIKSTTIIATHATIAYVVGVSFFEWGSEQYQNYLQLLSIFPIIHYISFIFLREMKITAIATTWAIIGTELN